MFNKRKDEDNELLDTPAQSPVSSARTVSAAEPVMRVPTAATHVPSRRPSEIAHGSSRRGNNDRSLESGERKLIVGKGLSLSGEITACDVLVVEGKVEAKLADGKMLEITESGQFKGNVEIENADIAGRYDGQLVVHGRLTVRGTGRISGVIKYGELEVNAGGQIIGEMQVTGGGAAGNQGFKSAAKFTSLIDEEDEASASSSRKAG